MKYEISNTDDAVTIAIGGQLIYSDTSNFTEILKRVEETVGAACILDLAGLEHIDSSGLRMVLLLHDACKERGAALTIKFAKGHVREMLFHCRFETIVDIVD